MFFKNSIIHRQNTIKSKVIFACDPSYWLNYGRYLIKSCDDLGLNVHVHIVGGDTKFFKRDVYGYIDTLKMQHSISSEEINEDILWYAKVTYYYIARYYAARYLFKECNLEEAIIVDTDVIFNSKIEFPPEKDIGIFYKPHKPAPFKQVWGNLFMIKHSKSWFIDCVLDRFEKDYKVIDWEFVHTLKGKKRVQNFVGQDQICIALEADKVCNDPGFFNIKSCNFFDHSIFSLMSKRDDPEVIKYLTDRFGF